MPKTIQQSVTLPAPAADLYRMVFQEAHAVPGYRNWWASGGGVA